MTLTVKTRGASVATATMCSGMGEWVMAGPGAGAMAVPHQQPRQVPRQHGA